MNVMSEIYSIENNQSLSLIGKEKVIDSIVSKQIDYSQKNKLQLPSLFTGLPAVVQWQIKDVLYHPNLTFEEKQAIIESLISKLPLEEQIIPPKDKCGGILREKSMFFDTYSTLVYSIRYTVPLTELKEKLSEEDFEKIFETLENKNLSMKEKLKEISEQLNSLDPDIQQRLFQLNGPMDVEPFQNKLLSKFREELKNAGKKIPTTTAQTIAEMPSTTSTAPKMASTKKKGIIFGTKIESNLNFAKLKKLMG
uniref:Uncharacterized protein n=1 Tax=Panagrolaimus davidi TaxID=227884 RepID=A0A914P848_9BILA